MPFKKGRTKTGGRVKGTPNKDNPIKVLLHDHSAEYFAKNIRAEDTSFEKDWKKQHKGEVFSRFEIDLLCMKSTDRVKAEVELLSYHTPKMQAISADMSIKDTNETLTDRISRLAAGEEIPADK